MALIRTATSLFLLFACGPSEEECRQQASGAFALIYDRDAAVGCELVALPNRVFPAESCPFFYLPSGPLCPAPPGVVTIVFDDACGFVIDMRCETCAEPYVETLTVEPVGTNYEGTIHTVGSGSDCTAPVVLERL